MQQSINCATQKWKKDNECCNNIVSTKQSTLKMHDYLYFYDCGIILSINPTYLLCIVCLAFRFASSRMPSPSRSLKYRIRSFICLRLQKHGTLICILEQYFCVLWCKILYNNIYMPLYAIKRHIKSIAINMMLECKS